MNETDVPQENLNHTVTRSYNFIHTLTHTANWTDCTDYYVIVVDRLLKA